MTDRVYKVVEVELVAVIGAPARTVGVAMEPPVFLRSGDAGRCEIDGIGTIEHRIAG